MAKLSMICLGKGAKLSPKKLTATIEQMWPGLPVSQPERKEGEKAIVFSVGGAMIGLMVVPAPIPWTDLEGPCATSVLWPEAESVLKEHVGHVIVSVLQESDPIQATILLTQVTAAVLQTAEQALGVYYGDGGLVVRPDMYCDFATEFLPDEFPLHIWIHLRIGGNEDGTTSAFTQGMEALGHKEIETTNASDVPSDLADRLMAIAGYLLANGPVIEHGHTVGEDEHERIQCLVGTSSFGHENPVMKLVYEPLQQQKKKGFFGRF